MEIAEKIIFITGAGSGMGAATAKLFAKKRAKVALLDLNLEKATAVAQETGGIAIPCHVGDESQVKRAIATVIETYGRAPDICVNCAGIVYGKRVVGKEGAMPLADFQKVIDVNLVGTFNVMRLVAEAMTKNPNPPPDADRGVIINTASIAAFEGQIGQVAYSASKGGVVAMTLPAARELSRFQIRVVTIAPGLVETPMLGGMTPDLQAALLAATMYPKRLGKAEEFAALVAHIVENNLLNGTVIRLDGAVRLQA